MGLNLAIQKILNIYIMSGLRADIIRMTIKGTMSLQYKYQDSKPCQQKLQKMW